jgi:hypothetical protein
MDQAPAQLADAQFAAAVDQALRTPDIRSELDGPNQQIDDGFVRKRLDRRRLEIERQLGSAQQEVERTTGALAELRREAQNIRAAPWHAELLAAGPGCGLMVAIILGVLALIGIASVRNFFAGIAQFQYFSAGHIALALILAVTAWGALSHFRWKRRLSELDAQPEADSSRVAREQLAQAQSGFDEALKGAITKAVFEILGESGEPFYQDRILTVPEGVAPPPGLRASSPRGLSEVAGEGNQVATAEGRDILYQLTNLPGASIGLSGPRGAGKSTLLRSLTAANLRLNDREAICIYTAAPVEYDARDFLLHVFATLCRRVLSTHRAEVREQPEEDGPPPLLSGSSGRAVKASLLTFGICAITVSLALGIALYGSLTVAPGKAPAPTGLLSVMDVKPGSLLLFGITSLLLWAGLETAGRVSHAAARLRTLPPGRTDLPTVLKSLLRRRADNPVAAEEQESELVPISRRNLADIRFQRSFTSGWSGALKVPVGMELGTSSSTSLAERQESLPELVERFRGYVRQIAAVHGTVVIAIDELDKLKTGTEAEKFINELKSIFNIPNCFYLVSVSEDALSAFERRGLALRDAFDSAFDDIRYIGQMDLDGCRKMLIRRVLSLPEPFLCLCYVLSGGLPRDVIRAARDMFDLVRPSGAALDIVAVATEMLKNEAAAKLRAAIAATRSLALEPETSKFILAVTELQEGNLGDPQFQTRLEALKVAKRTGIEIDQNADQYANPFARLSAVQTELSAYLSFLANALALAKTLSTEQGWRQVTAAGKVEQLAQIRRALEWNIAAASARLAKISSG